MPGQAAAKTISVTVNGARESVQAGTLADLVQGLGFAGERVATALNGAFVSQSDRTATEVADGDSVEVLSARQGG